MNIYLGFDAQEMRAHVVATTSLHAHSGHSQRVQRICRLSVARWYTRPTKLLPAGLWDVISDAPMTTDHAIARFFVPFLMNYQGWALFTDGDVLFRADVRQLSALADDRYAVQVVQHPPLLEYGMKKDGQPQWAYPRKNWSSVILWNCGHPANQALTRDVLNSWPGRDLHAFTWLKDEEIGALPAAWNHLVNVSPPDDNPALVHFTLGTPDLPGHDADPFAEEWRSVARAAGYSLPRTA